MGMRFLSGEIKCCGISSDGGTTLYLYQNHWTGHLKQSTL